jgi:hypothetical protein
MQLLLLLLLLDCRMRLLLLLLLFVAPEALQPGERATPRRLLL